MALMAWTLACRPTSAWPPPRVSARGALRTIADADAGRRSTTGALAEGDLDLALLAVADDRQAHGVAGPLVELEVGHEVLRAADRLAVDRDDDVAAGRDLARPGLLALRAT